MIGLRRLRERLRVAAHPLIAIIASALTVGIAVPSLGNAQPPAPGVNAVLDSARAQRGESLEISVVTIGIGDDVFERFGHNALVVTDTTMRGSIAYNWGMFDFEQPNFLSRFLTGDTKYWLEAFNTEDLLAYYRRSNRTIRIQTLRLTPVQRAALAEFAAWNAQEANKFYRYDYYNDNCSTRVRDALDRVLGGQLRELWTPNSTNHTWRTETARALAASLPLYAGIEIALGRHADRPITEWESGFLPEYLALALAEASVTDDVGSRRRIVSRDTVIFTADRVGLPSEEPDWTPMAVLIGLALAGLIALLADSAFAPARIVLAAGVITWYAVCGLLGTALLLAATVTKHAPYMGANLNLLAVNPLSLLAAVLVPIAIMRKYSGRITLGIAMAVALLSLLAICLQLVPSLAQRSGVVLAVIVPVNIALAFAVYRLHSGEHRSRRSRYQPR